MAELVMVIGKSGAGKSHSLKDMDVNRTLVVNVCGKRLPIPTQFKYTFKSMNMTVIKDQLKKMPSTIKAVVLDDFGYIMTDLFMKGHSGGDQFKLYNAIGDTVYNFFNFVRDELPEDVIVYVVMHEDESDNGSIKPRTIGKLLDQKVCLEGMVTVCLRAMATKDGRHIFRVQSDGTDVAKTPEGMFEGTEIENDLAAVDKRIREFWSIVDLPPKPAQTTPPASNQRGTVTTSAKLPTDKTADKKAS